MIIEIPEIPFQIRFVCSCVAFVLLGGASRFAKSKSFYYSVGVLIGVVAGFWVLSRNKGRLENVGIFVNAFGFAVSWIDWRFRIVYGAAAAFCGFCAAHIYLHDFNPDSPHTDVAKWTMWVLGAAFSLGGVWELNAAFAVAFVTSFGFGFVWNWIRYRPPATPAAAAPAESDSDTDLDEPPTEEEIAAQREYYLEGRRNAIKHMRRILHPNEMVHWLKLAREFEIT